jgi:OFA family oxalate/formate antiporter-like MFS transporter
MQAAPAPLPARWRFAAAAVVMQLCLGVLYSWAVFRGPLAQLYGWPRTTTIAPFRYSLLAFTVAMILGGFWQDRKGPRVVASVGGLLVSIGCLLAATIGDTPAGLIFAYGVVGGFGVGLCYVTPIATCIKWFPDKRGMIVGVAVMGFGAGSLIFAPLLEALLGSDPARFATTIPRTFVVLAGVFFVFVIGAAQFYRVPPPGWRPASWNPPAAPAAGVRADYTSAEMMRTPQIYGLWVVYFLGASIGLTAIGESTPLVRDMAQAGAFLSGGAALGVMSLFNGLGRLTWGAVSDRIGRNRALLAMCTIYVIAFLGLLRGATTFPPVLAGLCLVGLCFGGFLAIMPALTADFYGPKNVGANYGILFSAYGLGGFLVPAYFASIMETARQSGDLAGGYNSIYMTLAALAVAAGVVAALVRRPRAAS